VSTDEEERGWKAAFSGRRVGGRANSIWAGAARTLRGSADAAAAQRVQDCLRVALRDNSVEVLQVLSRGGLASVYRSAFLAALCAAANAGDVCCMHLHACTVHGCWIFSSHKPFVAVERRS
jgi:hypothetical protein